MAANTTMLWEKENPLQLDIPNNNNLIIIPKHILNKNGIKDGDIIFFLKIQNKFQIKIHKK